MKTIYKQCIGIDCSKDKLDVCYGQLDQELKVNLLATRSFANSPAGIGALLDWGQKLAESQPELLFVVEATGVYHQELVYELSHQERFVSVVLPSRASHFAKTLKVRTITDRSACRALATMGLEKTLDRWTPPNRLFAAIKQLTRERKRLKDQITRLKSQRHAIRTAVEPSEQTLHRIERRLELYQRQIKQIEQEISSLIESDETIKSRFDYVCSIDGVGLITAATVVSEANGFARVRNVRQLVSYAGYDVVQKRSGTSVRGKPRISKKGNSYIRRALYFPAITAVQKNPALQTFYERLYHRHGIKIKAYTAVQRKLLVLIYTMWAKQVRYDPNYAIKTRQPKKAALHELA